MQTHALIREDDEVAYGDSGALGMEKRQEIREDDRLFQIVKRYFGCRKTLYRGIAKNMNKFFVLFGCANRVMCIRAGRTEEFSACDA